MIVAKDSRYKILKHASTNNVGVVMRHRGKRIQSMLASLQIRFG